MFIGRNMGGSFMTTTISGLRTTSLNQQLFGYKISRIYTYGGSGIGLAAGNGLGWKFPE